MTNAAGLSAMPSIAFVSEANGSRDVWVMDAEGKNPLSLTDDPGLEERELVGRIGGCLFISEEVLYYVGVLGRD